MCLKYVLRQNTYDRQGLRLASSAAPTSTHLVAVFVPCTTLSQHSCDCVWVRDGQLAWQTLLLQLIYIRICPGKGVAYICRIIGQTCPLNKQTVFRRHDYCHNLPRIRCSIHLNKCFNYGR